MKLQIDNDALHYDPLTAILELVLERAKQGETSTIAPETKLAIDAVKLKLRADTEILMHYIHRAMSRNNSYLFWITLDELSILDVVSTSINDLKSYREGSIFHKEPNVFEHTMTILKLADSKRAEIKYMILYHDICKPVSRRLYGNGKDHDSAEVAKPLIDKWVPDRYREYILMHIEYHQRVYKVFEGMSTRKIYNLILAFKDNPKLLKWVIKIGKYDKDGATPITRTPHKDLSTLLIVANIIYDYNPNHWVDNHYKEPSIEEVQQHIRHYGYTIIDEYITNKGD